MECTNCGEKCAYVQSGFCKTDRDCPYFVETLWTHHDHPQPKLIKDCFPKKFVFEQNNLLHQMICVQSVLEELKFRIKNLEEIIKQLILQNNSLCVQNEILSNQVAISFKKNGNLEIK
ncbi:MAG: hypothetical protein ABI417_21375 [Coleofasciculaceae cyanobacterium]